MTSDFDIAIVGMAGRFPGAPDVDALWRDLAAGREPITRLSDQEILDAGVPASYLTDPNYVKAAPLLEGPGLFDAAFFGFSPMEARTIDPQHRILLELAHEALEHAGYDAERYPGRIAVFTGAALNTYFTNVGLNRSEEHTSELQSQSNLVCRLLLEKKNQAGDRLRRAGPPPEPAQDSRPQQTTAP